MILHDFVTRENSGHIQVKASELYVETNKDPVRTTISVQSGDLIAKLPSLQFDYSSDQIAFWFFPMPLDYFGTPLKIQTLYCIYSGQIPGSTNWKIRAKGFNDKDNMTHDFGDPIYYTNNISLTDYGKLRVLKIDRELIPNGSLGPGCMIGLSLERDDVGFNYIYPIFFINAILTYES